MKTLTKLALALFLTAGCGREVPRPQEPKVPATTLDNTSKRYGGNGWEVTLDKSWAQRRDTDDESTFVAVKEKESNPSSLVLIIRTLEIPQDNGLPDTMFGAATVEAVRRNGAKVLVSSPSLFGGKPGYMAVVVRPDSDLVFFQAAVGSSSMGFLAVCGGPVTAADWVIEECQLALDTFNITK